MSIDQFTEDSYEQALIALFKEMGYQYECGYDVERDYREPYDAEGLRKGLRRMNPMLTNVNEGTLEQRNEQLMDYLQSGVEVKYSENGSPKTALVKLIDFSEPKRNDFKIVNQWTVIERDKIRCDMVAFVNGLPLVVIELKSPSREDTDEADAYTQIKQYQQKCPGLFVFNAFSVTSDMLTTKAGTITAKANRYMEAWMVKKKQTRLLIMKHSFVASLRRSG